MSELLCGVLNAYLDVLQPHVFESCTFDTLPLGIIPDQSEATATFLPALFKELVLCFECWHVI
jgi:hypothetical protein